MDDEIDAECPQCTQDVGYDEWEDVGIEGACQCPHCGYVARVDELF